MSQDHFKKWLATQHWPFRWTARSLAKSAFDYQQLRINTLELDLVKAEMENNTIRKFTNELVTIHDEAVADLNLASESNKDLLARNTKLQADKDRLVADLQSGLEQSFAQITKVKLGIDTRDRQIAEFEKRQLVLEGTNNQLVAELEEAKQNELRAKHKISVDRSGGGNKG